MLGERTIKDVTIAEIDAGLPAVEAALTSEHLHTRVMAAYAHNSLLRRRAELVAMQVEAGTHQRVLVASAVGETIVEAMRIEALPAGPLYIPVGWSAVYAERTPLMIGA